MKKIWIGVIIGFCLALGLGALLLNAPRPSVETGSAGVKVDAAAVADAEGTVRCEGSVLPPEAGMKFIRGRLFLERKATESWLEDLGIAAVNETGRTGGTDAGNGADSSFGTGGGPVYVSLNDLCRRRNLWPVFSDCGVTLYRYRLGWEGCADAENEAADQAGTACLRLEDIMADPTSDSRFTHEGLEKLRVMARWLKDRSQEFSVAWIPVYVSPQEGIVNDLTGEFNWYNADFLYTLDVLAENGGHIGLHGLTHQYGMEVSAAGWEFGEGSPYPAEEVERRLKKAAAIAEALGYPVEFFEFPHYAVTQEQAQIAEKYFRVIYQQEPWTEPYGYIETKSTDGQGVMYVPTPADYVQSEYDLEGTLERLRESHEAGRLVSLFFHPSLDYGKIQCSVEEVQSDAAAQDSAEPGSGAQPDGQPKELRLLRYDEDRGILPAIVRQIRQWDLRFGVVW